MYKCDEWSVCWWDKWVKKRSDTAFSSCLNRCLYRFKLRHSLSGPNVHRKINTAPSTITTIYNDLQGHKKCIDIWCHHTDVSIWNGKASQEQQDEHANIQSSNGTVMVACLNYHYALSAPLCIDLMLTLWRWNEQDRLNKYLIYYRSQSGEDGAR